MAQNNLAVIDMGSNSFHLLIAAPKASGWEPLCRDERKVQLAANRQGRRLCDEAVVRALSCLRLYLARIKEHGPCQLRIAATASLRGVDSAAFLQAAEDLCGVRPQILSGEDEARFVYRGVCAEFTGEKTYLVVDVGGGSTELALGRGKTLLAHRSFDVGCLSYLRFFVDNALSASAFLAAQQEAMAQFVEFLPHIPPEPVTVVGSSGSLLAVEAVLKATSKSRAGIHVADLTWLAEDISRFDALGEVAYGGLSEDRRGVFASGLAIVVALFGSLRLTEMQLSLLGLREGLLAVWLDELQGLEQLDES
ncbi:Ppx/GppA phosphatase family [Spongiibacter sp. IMCC21906]|uniref:Ppx/GppA phosphatase family protein n=1 Tax=Spongiibacter sp. IMCC21906 TaxID=1620392 RepID=UPI00062DEFB2|nr:hypothetical protein [Spongiibacter sp. IMCC21906]AKH68303.1 Ppx/GppA phosphatase family [Spongiibacter sp. IMCC21906]